MSINLKKIQKFLQDRLNYPEVRKICDANSYITFKHLDIDDKSPVAIVDSVLYNQESMPNTKLKFGYFNRIIRQRVGYAFGRKCSFSRDKDLCEILFNMDVIRECAWYVTLHGKAWLEILFGNDGKMSGIMAHDAAHCFEFNDSESGSRAFIVIEEVKDEFGMEQNEILSVRTLEDVGNSFEITTYRYANNTLQAWEINPVTRVKKLASGTSNMICSDIVMKMKQDPFENGLFDEIKSEVDEYDRLSSETSDFIKKTPRNPIVIKGYSTSMSELVNNLVTYNVIPVTSDGDVGVLSSSQNVEAVSQMLSAIERSMYEQSGAVKSESESSSYSGSALRMKYASLDISAQYLQSIMSDFFDRARPYMQSVIGDQDIDVIFDSDVLVNESDTIVNCNNSQGIISKRTILENHPWVVSVDQEIERLKDEGEDIYAIGDEDVEEENSNEDLEEDTVTDEAQNWDGSSAVVEGADASNTSESHSTSNNQKKQSSTSSGSGVYVSKK